MPCISALNGHPAGIALAGNHIDLSRVNVRSPVLLGPGAETGRNSGVHGGEEPEMARIHEELLVLRIERHPADIREIHVQPGVCLTCRSGYRPPKKAHSVVLCRHRY